MDSLYLVHHGVPFDVAFSLSSEERLNWVIVFGTIRGGTYDRESHRWLGQN